MRGMSGKEAGGKRRRHRGQPHPPALVASKQHAVLTFIDMGSQSFRGDGSPEVLAIGILLIQIRNSVKRSPSTPIANQKSLSSALTVPELSKLNPAGANKNGARSRLRRRSPAIRSFKSLKIIRASL
jgi:hypothetical protein